MRRALYTVALVVVAGADVDRIVEHADRARVRCRGTAICDGGPRRIRVRLVGVRAAAAATRIGLGREA